ncbi:MAG: multicopper oxidase domain-containing protein, partial [Verrucomicrobia bacterium]|nr:multicopper oxidase domain-containing protein [Verrucomicrobiota bacterium]
LAVTFLNRASQPLSMHPHGVRYDKDNEGSYYLPRPGLGAAVAPGARFTYVWELDEASGPAPGEPSSKGWLYHSHVNGDEEANLGLVGFLIVTDPKRARPDGTPADVDREQAALFMVFDESGLGEAEREAAEYASLDPALAATVRPSWQVQEQIEQGARHAINGRLFGNLSGLEANEGERVRWYLFGLGSEKDFHTAHWHGARVVEEGRRATDTVDLLPATMKVADMRADNPGSWLFHCHVADHMTEGMFARFTVHPKGEARTAAGPAFFGDVGVMASLRITSAEIQGAGTDASATLRGGVTVFDGFSVFNQPVEIELAGVMVRFTPDRTGRFRSDSAEFTVLNASPFGVVYGGEMEFRLILRGMPWRRVLEGALSSPGRSVGSQSPGVPLRLQVGRAIHHAEVRWQQPAVE